MENLILQTKLEALLINIETTYYTSHYFIKYYFSFPTQPSVSRHKHQLMS